MISLNQIPANLRTPGAYVEIDNSKAISGLPAAPRKILLIGLRLAAGTTAALTALRWLRKARPDVGLRVLGCPHPEVMDLATDYRPWTTLTDYARSLAGGAIGAGASAGLATGSAGAAGAMSSIAAAGPDFAAPAPGGKMRQLEVDGVGLLRCRRHSPDDAGRLVLTDREGTDVAQDLQSCCTVSPHTCQHYSYYFFMNNRT